jgi:hypothetical protein
MRSGLKTVTDVRWVELPRFARDDGEVVVAEAQTRVPFAIARLFTLKGVVGAERGKHAHKLCSQFMLCVNGTAEVICDDGVKKRTFLLDQNNRALMVPPGIWNTVIFHTSDSVMAVLCDRPYEVDDYLRDYDQFLDWRKTA